MLLSALADTAKILAIVFLLMVAVEFAEVRFGRGIRRALGKPGLRQYVLASALGVVPGCVDAFLVVSLYKAGLVSFGAVAAVLLATAGDEAFVMLATIPKVVPLVFGLCFIVGVIGGAAADAVARRLRLPLCERCGAEIHPSQVNRLGWRHFLQEHVYGHIVRKHLLSLFLWLFLTLLALKLVGAHLDLQAVLPNSHLLLVVLAALIGLLPESGPHLVFVVLYAKGMIPFSVLAASAVAQDGHGILPLLAYAVKDAVFLKVLTACIGLVVGLALLALGY